jgi:hypothetical protein
VAVVLAMGLGADKDDIDYIVLSQRSLLCRTRA